MSLTHTVCQTYRDGCEMCCSYGGFYDLHHLYVLQFSKSTPIQWRCGFSNTATSSSSQGPAMIFAWGMGVKCVVLVVVFYDLHHLHVTPFFHAAPGTRMRSGRIIWRGYAGASSETGACMGMGGVPVMIFAHVKWVVLKVFVL